MRLTKEEFIHAIESFRDMVDQETAIVNSLDISPEWVPSQWINAYYEFIIAMCDIDREDDTPYFGNDIDYYCFELDFGRRETRFKRPDVDLHSVDDLWELLMSKK